MKKFSFSEKVWIWPGVGGWHFVNVPESIGKGIRQKYGKGMIKVSAKINKTTWPTSLFPYKNPRGDFAYLLSVKKSVRYKEEIMEGDIISITFNII